MRLIHTLVVHCSATPPSSAVNAAQITRIHQQRGFSTIGYHYVILRDGTLERGRDVAQVGAHAKGHNAHSIGVCLTGGLDERGQPAPSFTHAQMRSLKALCAQLSESYPIKHIVGHRDLSPDQNGDGIITPEEWLKECPCFEVSHWLETGELRHRGRVYAPREG